jgi:LysW-gamma-L-lysine carboxypeptidase
MRQKVRAGEIALAGTCDVAITGPNTLSPTNATWFWRAPAPAPDLALLARSVELSSVSRDEREIAGFLAGWCREQGIPAQVDAAGNLVATKGSGPRRLLMLGHLDTLPHRWPVQWDGDVLTGRGSVDAKASLVACLSALATVDVPDHVQVRLVGAVQQETTAAGALFARDHYPADAVIVGEPGGAQSLAVGCHGLVQVRLSVVEATGHTAVRTAGDRTAEAIQALRAEVALLNQDAAVAILGMHAVHGGDVQTGQAVVNIRVPQRLALADLLAVLENAIVAPVHLKVLRATPYVSTPRSSALVSAFDGAFRAVGTEPCFVVKKGGSDMSTMAMTGHRVPMVAYGPGDPKLDHTPHERIDAAEFRRARTVLTAAVRRWIAAQPAGVPAVPATGTARTDR